MNKKMPKRLLVAAVLTTLIVSSAAIAQEYTGGSSPNGGAIDNSSGVTVTVEDGSVFTGNEATADYRGGGAIYNAAQGAINIGNNVRFENNYLNGVNTGNNGTAGGAIASWDGGSVTIGTGSQFINNGYTDGTFQTIGGGAGGAIYVSGGGNGTDPQGSLTIGTGALFQGNATNGSGGAVYAEGSSVSIGSNSTFDSNKSTSGGAIYNYQYNNIESKIEIGDNVSFTNNIVKDNSGGAVANFGGTFETGKDTVFSRNRADYGGGAIRNTGTAIIGAGSQFINNTSKANDGYGGGGAIDSSGTITINGGYADAEGKVHNTIFSGNEAVSGGAIFSSGTTNLAAAEGDILFAGNTDATGKNDIFVNTNSVVNLSGKNDISIGSGIASAENAGTAVINNTGANLILEEGSVNAGYKGSFVQTSGSTDVKSEFFGGVSDFNGGSLTLENGSSVVSGSTVNVNRGATVDMQNGASVSDGAVVNITEDANVTIDVDSNVNVSGSITAAAGTFVNNGNLTITGENASLNGSLSQTFDGAVLTIADGAQLDIVKLDAGTLKITQGGALADDLTITDAVTLAIESGTTTIDSQGLQVGNHYIKNTQGSSLNLSGDYVVAGGVLGTSVTITDGSINADPEGDITIADPNKLTLSDNASSDKGFVLNDGTIQLAPSKGSSLTLNENNKISGTGEVLVDQIVITKQVENPDYDPSDSNSPQFITKTIEKGVGNIDIGSDNSGFKGNFLQKMGTVIAQAGSKFFGGTNSVEGGTLVLQDGADLTTGVTAQASTEQGNNSFGSIDIYNQIKGTAGEDGINRISADSIANGNNAVLEYINSDETTNKVYINSAGLGLFNGTRVEGDLILNSGSGVRDLTFGSGSGSEADNIKLNVSTKLTYADNAYIKDDSAVTMNNATLEFANNTTDVAYKPAIADGSSGSISMTGAGTTSVASALNGNINISATNGVLNLDNKTTTNLGNVTANNGAINLKADSVTVGSVSVSGQTGSANFSGNVTSSAAASVSDGGTLGLMGNANFDSLTANNGNLNLTSGAVNTVNIDNGMTVSGDSSIFFDADPRSQMTDTIIVGGGTGTIDAGTGTSDDPYRQIIVGGINFTQSPIDRNVQFDISNLIQGNSTNDNLIRLPDGGIITNTAMGQYLLTSSGAGTPMVNANLTYLNPQMYRGQVATIAAWQNQLLVNNLLFDHMNLVTRQLMDEERTANKYAAAVPQIDPYQYSIQDGSLWFKAYGAFETLSMTKGLNVGNNAYGSLIGADFPLIDLKNGWKLVPTAYIGYNGAHQHFNGVSMYQNGAQLGLMGTAYKGDFMTSLLAYGGGYANDMTVRGGYGGGSDTTGNWFAGVASKSAYNIRLPHDFIIQPAFMAAYNAFGQQNWGSDFGNMSMSSGMLNGLNVAPGVNFIWQKKTFSIYAVTQLVYNVMGGVDGKAGNIDLGYVRMRHCYFEYGLGVMKKFKDTFSGYLQFVIRNGGRTGIGFSGGMQWKVGKE